MSNEKNSDEGQSLCLSCGLCCTDYFYSEANISNEDDRKIVLKFGGKLAKHDNKQWLHFPCPAFAGKCTIYKERPSVCRKHQCDLLKDVLHERIDIVHAKTITKKIKEIISELTSLLNETSESNAPVEFKQRFYHFFEESRKIRDTPVFKQKHAPLLMKFATFTFLKHKYFYKSDERG